MFITLEGIEGCGKSTQAERLTNRLKAFHVPCLATLEPGGTEVGKDIRRILLDPRNTCLAPLAELFLYEADRAQHVREVIKPALERGEWVICDRYFDATTAYQGYARGEDIGLIRTLNRKASQGLLPDITFLLDCPVEIGLSRAIKRNERTSGGGDDRFERELLGFHRAVREGYLSLAKESEERFVLVDAALPEDEVEAAIFDRIFPLLNEAGL